MAAWVYNSARTYAWRYLFPGIAAALIFVVFPILYTMAIGFTNYSSKNLLTFERATRYLLDETHRAEGTAYAFSLHGDGREYRGRLENEDATAVFVTAALALSKSPPLEVDALPLQTSGVALADPLPLKDVIALQPKLRALTVKMPDGRTVRMTSLREFAPVEPLYEQRADGTLVNRETGAVLKANKATGFYETAGGERVAPGFGVDIGWDNYARIFTDKAFQEPFVRIFVWTRRVLGAHRGIRRIARHVPRRAAELGRAALQGRVPHAAVPALCRAGVHLDPGVQGTLQQQTSARST